MATTNVLQSTPQDGDHGSASSSEQRVVIVAGGGNTVIDADVLAATAAVKCTAGSPTFSGSASVADVTVNGTAVKIGGGPQDVTTPAGTLHIDATYSPAPNILYYRTLWLATDQGDIVVSEAAVAYVGSPCTVASGSGSGSGGSGNGNPGPPPPQQFGCRAIALKIGDAVEPVIANDQLVPCANDDKAELTLGAGGSALVTGGVYAHTFQQLPQPLTFPVPAGDGVLAQAGMENFDLGSGSTEVHFEKVSSESVAYCRDSTLKFIADSTVQDLVVGGQSFGDLSGPQVITLPQGTLNVNWVHYINVQGAPYAVETRALWWQPAAGPDVVIGDTLTGVTNAPTNPC